MKNILCIPALLTLLLLAGCAGTDRAAADEEGWITLYGGEEDLENWTVTEENPSSFYLEDGAIVAHGPRAHLFYTGDVENHDFENFEFKADVMTTPGSNSGIYFHTEYQDEGWPSKGYEVQVNNTQQDWRRTGSLYAIDDVREAPAGDNEWFTEEIIVRGNRIITKVNGETLVDYVEPENAERPEGMAGRFLSSGTFALQAHDPDSKVYFRNIQVRPLED